MTLGCCCHIASVINFLALVSYSIDHLKCPANNLTSIFPFDFENEEPLKPNLKISTQKKRTKKLNFEISSSDFDAESENESEKEAEIELRCSKQIKQSQSIQKIKLALDVKLKRIGGICYDGNITEATGSGAGSHHGGIYLWIYVY